MFGKSQGKRCDTSYIPFGISSGTLHMPNFRQRYVMTWGKFMVIVETGKIFDLTHSKTLLEKTVKIEPQPVALAFNNLSQYSSRSK